MTAQGSIERVYVVTDIEVDGFVPGAHSMLALASVAVTRFGEREAPKAGSTNGTPDRPERSHGGRR